MFLPDCTVLCADDLVGGHADTVPLPGGHPLAAGGTAPTPRAPGALLEPFAVLDEQFAL